MTKISDPIFKSFVAGLLPPNLAALETDLIDLIMENIQLTLHVKLDWGVGHAHHILGNAGQLEVVVVSADVKKSQVDGVDVRPVNIRLREETRGHK